MEVLRLRIRVPGPGSDQMNLEADGVRLVIVHLVMDQRENARPVPCDILIYEVSVQRDPSVALDAEK